MPWITRGLLWGRPIVPGLPWVWGIVGVFFVVYLALNIVFDRPVRACAGTLADKPLTAFAVGLLVLLLAGPVCALLAVSVVGLVVVPFVLCALVVAGMVGKVGTARWIGMGIARRESAEEETRLQSLIPFTIGFCDHHGSLHGAGAGLHRLGAARSLRPRSGDACVRRRVQAGESGAAS